MLRRCEAATLARVECCCMLMRGCRVRRSPVKEAALQRLTAFPGAQLQVRSYPALLSAHEHALRTACVWGDAPELYEVGEEQDALQLGDSEPSAMEARAFAAAARVVARMRCQPKDRDVVAWILRGLVEERPPPAPGLGGSVPGGTARKLDKAVLRRAVVAAGAIPALLAILPAAPSTSTSTSTTSQHAGAAGEASGSSSAAPKGAHPLLMVCGHEATFDALVALGAITHESEVRVQAAVGAGALEAVVPLLGAALLAPHIQAAAAQVLANVLSYGHAAMVVAAGGVVPLVQMLKVGSSSGSSSEQLQATAADALGSLCEGSLGGQYVDLVVEAGALSGLVGLLQHTSEGGTSDAQAFAVYALRHIAEHWRDKSALLAFDPLPALLRLLQSDDDNASANAARTIGYICKPPSDVLADEVEASNDKCCAATVLAAGAVPHLVALLARSTSPHVDGAKVYSAC